MLGTRAAVFDGTGACVAPVLSLVEAPGDAHLAARGTFVTVDGVAQPAPRFSASSPAPPGPPPLPGLHAGEVLAGWGIAP
ncbi:hypothetical protein [Dactylosporangium sp. CA-233914]|uniref:hypothetical protein n=1 Tax=Dactylosporangium sp. CA-233914 TaxID=3239934 RepID=UPI003D8B5E36